MTPVEHKASAAQQLSKYLRAHAAREDELLGDYQALCEELPAPSMRYLARLILADEQRHQMIFGDLAETVFATDDLKARGMPILQGSHVSDQMVRQRTVAMLETLITREDDERLELAALSSTLEPTEESELWNVLLALVAHDTERHISWLEFMRDRML
ncbi:MAG: hypothetical protein ABSH29_17320 [Acidimicrobiales bacterium]|jgi:hypothetical protein